MIDRYTRPEMGHIFSLENKYAIWQEIEVLACEAHAEMGQIGITREDIRAMFPKVQLMRWRYNVLDLAKRGRFYDPLVASVFAPGGAWEI